MTKEYTEMAFESAIEAHLLNIGGYEKADPKNFDNRICIDSGNVIDFIKKTQPREWNYIENLHKDRAAKVLIEDLCKSLDSELEGCLNVLRHGFKCFGKTFRVAYFAPASGLNQETLELYKKNRLTVTRQVHFSPKDEKKSVDLVLSLNGIPLVTAELKNPLTGQTWKNAVKQYQEDRDPNELLFQFKKRTLVHFAVDPDQVHMTTCLEGKKTRFLPFNLGSSGGAGNPDNPVGYKTAYLWEQVWQIDSFLDIVARFIQREIKEEKVGEKTIKKEIILFPRYHQLDCVRKLVIDAKNRGVGKNYLVQHSAGSGKSNSIGWLAHRLAKLHDDSDQKVFDSIIVITDRLILDRQLQDTIFQFEHKQGVVEKIDQKSGQLADALKSAVPVIITTLQKFPFVTEKIETLPKRKYAVIVDEAHSSQGGERAAELKGVLSETRIKEEASKQAQDESLFDYEEEIVKTMARRGQQPNISFFAFTATPKFKTLEVFGQPGPDGRPTPFHVYSMRQAIEEGFILDVLKNYTTYKAFYKLVKSVEDDPEVDKSRAARALSRFMTLHPHSIAQKTELIVEHYRTTTQHKIGGKAKAMVVTSSRLQAVKYKLAFDEYIRNQGYRDLKTLVAFSGKVTDPDNPGVEYTEVQMNGGIPEKQLREEFKKQKYKFLIVAEKYQTGFNEPLLHTMYVDKRLDGIQAVQTLSRLNRRIPNLKEDTFVLDFVNERNDVKEAFQPYYEQTLAGDEVEVRQLYDLKAKLEGMHIFYKQEVEEFSKIFYKPKKRQSKTDHADMNSCIDKATTRFEVIKSEEQEEFRNGLVAYRNLYNFLSQIVPFHDSDLEKLYCYVRFLISKLPGKHSGPDYCFDNDVTLQYYRLEKISEGAIKLDTGYEAEVKGPTSLGTRVVREAVIELSRLIDKLNEKYGTEFTDADQLFFDSIKEDAMNDSQLRERALANTKENFGLVFNKALEDLFINRMEQNGDIAARFFNDESFKAVVRDVLMKEVYEQINDEKQNYHK